MDLFDYELFLFWKALEEKKVAYIMIGGYSVNFNGHRRSTGDVDIWLKDSLENRQRLRQAFVYCGMPDYPMVERMPFIPGWTAFNLNNSLELHIITEMKGLEKFTFDECLEKASIAEIEGVNIPFLHISQLIANKKAVNREKDQADIGPLEDIERKRERDEGNDHDPPYLSR